MARHGSRRPPDCHSGTPSQLIAPRSMDNQRLILFIVFSFSQLLLWEAWQDKHAPPPPAVTATNAPASTSTPPIPSQGLNAPAAAPAQAGFVKGARAVVETDMLRDTLDTNLNFFFFL